MLKFSHRHFGELFVVSVSSRRTRPVDRTLAIRFGLEIRPAVTFCVYVRVTDANCPRKIAVRSSGSSGTRPRNALTCTCFIAYTERASQQTITRGRYMIRSPAVPSVPSISARKRVRKIDKLRILYLLL